MKLKHEFIVREIAGEYVLIPKGKSALAFSGMITTNAVGAFICEKLVQEISGDALLEAVCEEFDVSRQTAEADTREFLDRLRANALL